MRRALLSVLALAIAAALAPAAAAGAPEIDSIAAAQNSALVAFGTDEIRVVALRPDGRFAGRTLPVPGRGRPDEVVLAAGPKHFFAAFRRANTTDVAAPVLSAIGDSRGVFGRRIEHERLEQGAVEPRIATDGSGHTVAWLGDAGLDFQRTTASGSTEPLVVVAERPVEQHRLAEDGTGNAWVVWSTYAENSTTSEATYARRIPPGGPAGPVVTLTPAAFGERDEVVSTAADGAGGVFVLTRRSGTVVLSHVEPGGSVISRPIGGWSSSAGTGVGPLLHQSRGLAVVVGRRSDESGRRNLLARFSAALEPVGDDVVLDDPRARIYAASGATDGTEYALLRRSRELRLVRVDVADGAVVRHTVDRGVRGRGLAPTSAGLAVDGTGRVYAAWSRGTGDVDDCPASIAYERVLSGSRLTPMRRIARCLPAG
jgi:hypothetical protein